LAQFLDIIIFIKKILISMLTVGAFF